MERLLLLYGASLRDYANVSVVCRSDMVSSPSFFCICAFRIHG